MHIVGGSYRELCCIPHWDAMFGSGARAAAALSRLSPGSVFYTYTEPANAELASRLAPLGLELELNFRPHPIVFAYFHPLSAPHIQPRLKEIEREAPIQVEGDAILRFGFIEGDAIVTGTRVVYDPQTWRNPAHFGANGSTAVELALVLNELELRALTGIQDVRTAAMNLVEKNGANAVVVKQGVRGVMVVDSNGAIANVPAYRSSRVFKIGTGDVFSAIFAHFWAERGAPPVIAADTASRSVAEYSATALLPMKGEILHLKEPVHVFSPGRVAIIGSSDTIGQYYTLEEAQFVLRELGTDVFCSRSDDVEPLASAVLVLAEGLSAELMHRIELHKSAGKPIVILQEVGVQAPKELTEGKHVTVTDDFTTAMYHAAWTAGQSRGTI